MPHIVTSLKRSSANYSHCPLKKRPIKYDPVEDSDSDVSYKGVPSPQSVIDCSEPENLSTKPEDLKLKQESLSSASSSSSISPPPISLVAGRGGNVTSSSSSPSSSPISLQYNNSSNYSGGYCGMPSPPQHAHHHPSQFSPSYLAVPQPLKPVSGGGPLEPISLNPPAAWSKIPASVAPASHIHHNYSSSAAAAGQRSSSYLDFSQVSSSSLSPFSSRSSVVIPQFHHSTSPSHFAPFSARDVSGSPPHVSPPLSMEPAYPVIKIEEAHRGSRPFSHHHFNEQNTKFYEEIITPVAAHQQHNFHHEQPSAKVIIKQERHCYPSPPHSHQSAESRDSVISHSSVSSSSSNSQNQQPIAPPPQLSQITPINVNGSVRYQCPDCNKSYSTFSGLSKHIQFHCASQNKKQFICKFCEKVYVSLGALKMHIRTHTLPCKCHLCGKAFSRPWLLQGHIRTHTGEKPFSCQHCNRAFADRSNLRAHLQTHSEVKKYSCKHCSKTFSRMSLLVKHEDSGCGGGSSVAASHGGPTSPNEVIVHNMSKLIQ